MKNVFVRYLLLCGCLFPCGITAQTPTHYEYELITEAEVRDFMQQVLWFCNYGRDIEEQRNEQFASFLEDSLRQMLRKQDMVSYQYELYGALLSKIDFPWVEVLTTGGIDIHHWRTIKRFQVGKKDGKLYLVPHYEKSWAGATVRAWQEEYDIPVRPATEAERSAIREDVAAYLDHRFPNTEAVDWTREQLLGHWRVDSTYTIRDGKKRASYSLAEYLLLYDGKFYNVKGSYYWYGREFLDHPGWWGLQGKHLFTSDGIPVNLFRVEEVAQHRLLLKRYYAHGPSFLQLTNLPKPEQTAREPQAIDHPEVVVVHQPAFDYIGAFKDSLAEVHSGYYSGMIDHTGKAWLPPVYDQLLPFNGRPFTFGQRGGQWHKINAEGEEIETLLYDDFIDLTGTLVIVQDKKERVGAIDSEGTIVVPFEYDMIFPRGNGFFEVKKDSKTGLVDQGGQEVIPPVYDDLMQMENGLYTATLAGKEGMIDPATGQFLLEPEYESIFKTDRYYQARRNDRLVLFDTAFQEVELPDYELMAYQGDGYLGVEENGKRGIVDIQGEVLIPIAYDDVRLTSFGIKVKQAGRWGLLDYDGELIIPMAYDELEVHDKLICFKKGAYWGLMDQSGRELLPAGYEELLLKRWDAPIQYAKVQKNGKARVVNLKGEYLTATAHDYVSFPRSLYPGSEEEWYTFKDNGKHGYLNETGEVAIPAQYDHMFFFEPGGYAVVELDGKYGLIDTNNQLLVPFIFDYLNFQADQPVIVVQYEGFYGLIENPVYQSP